MSIQAVAWVLENSTAELGARLVLIAIANHAHSDGTGAYPSYETIGQEARMDRRNAIAAVQRLEQDGHIKILRGGGRGHSNHYIILGLAGLKSGGDETSPFVSGNSDANSDGDHIKTVMPASPEPRTNRLTAVPNPKKPKKPVDNRTWAQKESDRRYGGEGARFLETTPEYIAEVEAKAEPPGAEVPKVVRPAEAARARSLIKSTLRKGS